MKDFDFDRTYTDVIAWAYNKQLIQKGNRNAQFVKLIEEVGELANGIARNDNPRTADAFGDILVVLAILAQQSGMDLTICFDQAYNQIKDRTGRTVNGVFIKDE